MTAIGKEKGANPATLAKVIVVANSGLVEPTKFEDVPGFADTETTFAELKERIAKTVALLETFTPAQFEGSEERAVELTFRSLSGTFRGETYLLSVVLPDFFFHIATAHGILRHNGLKIGKKDYYGTFN